MDELNKAIMHYNREGHFTKELLLGVESETPGALTSDILLSTLDNRAIVDEKLYKSMLNIQLDKIKASLKDLDDTK